MTYQEVSIKEIVDALDKETVLDRKVTNSNIEFEEYDSITIPWSVRRFLECLICILNICLPIVPIYAIIEIHRIVEFHFLAYIPIWFFIYSLIPIVLKWCLVGYGFQPNTNVRLNSMAYLRWYAVDKVFSLWNELVGCWVSGTIFIIIIYKMCGVKIAWNVECNTLLSYPTYLNKIGPGSVVSGIIDTFNTKNLNIIQFGTVTIEEESHVLKNARMFWQYLVSTCLLLLCILPASYRT